MKNIGTWLDADSFRTLTPVPVDSVSLYPENFQTLGSADVFDNNPTTWYTVIRQATPLPTGVTKTITDTMYLPSEQENGLALYCHLLSNNLDDSWLAQNRVSSPDFGAAVDTIYARGLILTNEANLPAGALATTSFYNLLDKVALKLNFFLPKRPKGSVRFEESCLHQDEGVATVRVLVVHTGFLQITYTNSDGDFIAPVPMWPGGGWAHAVFENSQVKVKGLKTATPGFVQFLGTILGAPLAANSPVEFYNPGQIQQIGIHFNHNTPAATYSVIVNGFNAANWYAKYDEHIDLYQASIPKLTVIAHYADNRNGFNTGATPMFGEMSSPPPNPIPALQIISQLSLAGMSPGNIVDLPDMYIIQDQDSNYSTCDLRETIFHEFGHSMHYRKVGQVFWINNIIQSLGVGDNGTFDAPYGDGGPSFFALTEGWADYIGGVFSRRKYDWTGLQTSERNWETGFNELGPSGSNYLNHLERIQWTYGGGVPRGLYFDLTDGAWIAEPWDQIQGFSPEDVYDVLTATVTRIEEFRDKWESLHPSTNNNALFDHYNVP